MYITCKHIYIYTTCVNIYISYRGRKSAKRRLYPSVYLPIYLHNKSSYRPKLILSCDSKWFRFMCFSLNKCVVNVKKDTWILWAHNPSKVFLLLHSVPTWWAPECWQVLAVFDNFAFVKSFCMHWVKSWGCTSWAIWCESRLFAGVFFALSWWHQVT
jgi:hypothetical protein